MSSETKNKTAVITPDRSSFDVARIKADFPILNQQINGHRLVYLDSAATAQKPRSVIKAIDDFYCEKNANIHRGLHTLAERATSAYEETRVRVARFVGGVDSEEIIFTSGTTESINMVAASWGNANINEGDEIVISVMEHHANLVPWVLLSQRKKAVLKQIPLTPTGQLDMDEARKIITSNTKLVAVAHMSNVLGTINPVAELAEIAHKQGALILADGAQAAPHMPIDIKALGVDFYAFSAHKMLGPTGVGVLWSRREILEKMPPYNTGGEMIREVYFDRVTWNELPHKFEAGTPNIAGVAAFTAALDYLEAIGMDQIRKHEIELTAYTIEQLLKLEGLKIQGPLDATVRGGAISFTDPEVHPHDMSTFLDSRGIAIRAGHHCAQPLMRWMNTIATARASLYIYNDEADIDALVDALIQVRRYFKS